MRWLVRANSRLFRKQTGFTLIEVLVAVAILAAIGVTFVRALDASNRGISILDEKIQAEALIRTQLDAIKIGPYFESGNYTVTVDLPPQYSMSINVTAPKRIGTADNYTSLEELMGESITTIQEITISVYRTGNDGDRPVLSIGTYKVQE